MSCLGNVLWFIFGGFFNALGWVLFGVLWSITIIGIPVGIQCFKMASLQLAPFGKEIVTVNDGAGTFILNVIWLVTCGWELALANLTSAFILAITIVGIPFAMQSLKLAKLSLMPFGKKVI